MAIAGVLGYPAVVFEADGDNFADALCAGPAAAAYGGAVLLTAGADLPSATAAYLAAHRPTRYAIGGPATLADQGANPVAGADRYATAAAVATRFFPAPAVAGFVTGLAYPDALAAGAELAEARGPILLVGTDTVPAPTAAYVAAHVSIAALVFGGPAAVGPSVMDVL